MPHTFEHFLEGVAAGEPSDPLFAAPADDGDGFFEGLGEVITGIGGAVQAGFQAITGIRQQLDPATAQAAAPPAPAPVAPAPPVTAPPRARQQGTLVMLALAGAAAFFILR